VRARIRLRKRNIRERREALTAARLILDQELEEFAEVEELLHVEGCIIRLCCCIFPFLPCCGSSSDKFSSLQNQLAPTRTTVLTTLSWIFPIDLLSPPDLLYTILNVPLPIPLSSTDPAPPLTLASWKEVTEDGVATALGYAAQVVHMMAIYLGKVLVYPITCVGSRSLIKDGISAMVGPRMSVSLFLKQRTSNEKDNRSVGFRCFPKG
jgi:UV radiation resistance-associated gene protein